MQVMIERCCGLDVHQETVVACVLTVGAVNPIRSIAVRTVVRMRTSLPPIDNIPATVVIAEIAAFE
jgi:hypothetical protein